MSAAKSIDSYKVDTVRMNEVMERSGLSHDDFSRAVLSLREQGRIQTMNLDNPRDSASVGSAAVKISKFSTHHVFLVLE